MESRRSLRLQQLRIEAEQRVFTANPLPTDEINILPEVATRPLTIPVPFQLPSHVIGEQLFQIFKDKTQQEHREQKQKAEFHAQNLTVLDTKPFVPAKSLKPLTEVDFFV